MSSFDKFLEGLQPFYRVLSVMFQAQIGMLGTANSTPFYRVKSVKHGPCGISVYIGQYSCVQFRLIPFYSIEKPLEKSKIKSALFSSMMFSLLHSMMLHGRNYTSYGTRTN